MEHDPYGLTDRPFQLTPDPRFYFESATHRKAMTYLGYGLAQGEGFIVITGEVGTGKTMLVGRLMATIDRARLTAINLVSTQLEGEDILRIVALALGVATDNSAKGQLLARIERFLHEQARGGKRTLLIVDEAQNLPISALEELRMLSNFQFGGQALLQIFLLGQPEFRDALAQPRFEQLRQRVIATHHLTAMNPDETAPYILHRLACAGWKGMPRFAQSAYDAFYRLTGGIPRRLNMLAGRVMLQGAIERLTDIDGDVVQDVASDLASESIMPTAGPQPLAHSMPDSHYERTAAQTAAEVGAGHAAELPASPLAAVPAVELPRYDSYVPSQPSGALEDAFPSAGGGEATQPAPVAEVPPPAIEQPPRYDGQAPAPFAPLAPPLSPLPKPRIAEIPPVEPASSAAAPAWQLPEPKVAVAPSVEPAPLAADPRPVPEAPQPGGATGIDYAARNAELEARLADQEALLRRTLALLVELVESEPLGPDGSGSGRGTV